MLLDFFRVFCEVNRLSTTVVLVGMMDSVHTFRWLNQFKETDTRFILLPSKKFRRFHPEIEKLINNNDNFEFGLKLKSNINTLDCYFDFLMEKVFSLFGKSHRAFLLSKLILKISPKYVHALEIQGAGYICATTFKQVSSASKFIITNWGSDIYYFQKYPDHALKITEALQRADYYSAECDRDYHLAKEFGFKGIELPSFPNAGGFQLKNLPAGRRTSERKQLIVKAYTGIFGLGEVAVEAITQIIRVHENLEVFFYSVDDKLEDLIKKVAAQFPNRIRYVTQHNPISHSELLIEFSQSRIYLGCSKSDGISTSFLEAIISGCYPIQTNTSCASEWIQKGFKGSIITPHLSEITTALTNAINSDNLVDKAQETNLRLSRKYLSEEVIRPQSLLFYQ
jgi:hypothetical protein